MAKAAVKESAAQLRAEKQHTFEQFLPVALHEINTHCGGLADDLQASGVKFSLLAPHDGDVGTLIAGMSNKSIFAPNVSFIAVPGEGWRAFFSGTDFPVRPPATLDARPEYAALFESNARTWLKLPIPTPTLSPAAAPVVALLSMSKFIVSSSALLKVLQPLSAVIVHNPVVPVLSNFLFQLTDGTLAITASDLEVSMTTSLPVESRAAALDICVPSRILLDLLKQLPDQPLTFDVDEHEHKVRVNSANGRYSLSGEEAANYPKVPTVRVGANALEVPSGALARAISKTIFGLSSDELRPAMTGVLLEIDPNCLTFVATDGHRLLRYRRLDVGGGARGRVIIPKKAWALLKSTLPSEETPVAIALTPSNAFFNFQQLQLVTRLIDERYPDYENVIPLSNPNQLLINRSELLHAVRRCSLMANKTTHQIRLALENAQVAISAEDLDFSNEAQETLACQYDGAPLEIGFNSRFLTEMLANYNSEEVTLSMSTPSRAGVLTPTQTDEAEDVLMLVMPVMLNHYV